MAIAIPLIMGAMGASTMAVTLTSIAFAVTGISAKINEAASSVFGADLVQIASMFGTVAGATGAFGGSLDPTAGDYTNAMDMASDAVTNAGPDGFLANMQSSGDAANASYGGDAGAVASQADAVAQMGGDSSGFNLSTMAQPDPTQAMSASPGAPSPMELANQTQTQQSIIPGTEATGNQAASTNAAGSQAAGSNATAAQPGIAQNATARIQAPGAVGQVPPNPNAAGVGEPSFLQRLGMTNGQGGITNSGIRMGGQLLQGIGQGYTAAQRQKMEQEQFDRRMGMMNQRTGVTVTR